MNWDFGDVLYDDLESCNYYDLEQFNSHLGDVGGLFVFHVNIRSYRAHHPELLAFLDNLPYCPSIIIITETWFGVDSISDIDGYKSFNSFRENRGGVSVFVRDDMQAMCVEPLSKVNNDMELCTVNVKLFNNLSINIIGVYRPPSGNLVSFNESFFGDVLSSSRSVARKTVVAGDFNVDLLNPIGHELDFITSFHTVSFMPLVTKATRVSDHSASCIDHIWTDMLMESIPGIFNVSLSDHFPIFLILKCSRPSNNVKVSFRDHSKRNIDHLMRRVGDFGEFFERLQFEGVDYGTELFCDLLYNAYDECCPIKKKSMGTTRLSKPWINDELRLIINRRHALYRDYKRGELSVDRYKRYCNRVTNLINHAKNSYFLNKFANCKGDLKKTWKTVNIALGRGNRKRASDYNIKINDTYISENEQVANAFNDHFSTIGQKLERDIPQPTIDKLHFMGDRVQHSMFAGPCSSKEVEELITSLPNKGSGLRTVPTFIFKLLAPLIGPIIANIFNKSVQLGVYLKCLKKAEIIPVFKSGDRSIIINYRPISILSILSKIIEKLMHKRVTSFINRHNLLNKNQFGFRQDLSTVDAVLEYMDRAYTSLDSREYFTTVFLDFAKAFDTVNHEVLLSKLDFMGIRGNVLDWFKTYIEGRSQQVSISDSLSRVSSVDIGLPQGSVISPLLFNLYINDMGKSCAPMGCSHFADDTTLVLFPCLYRICDDADQL